MVHEVQTIDDQTSSTPKSLHAHTHTHTHTQTNVIYMYTCIYEKGTCVEVHEAQIVTDNPLKGVYTHTHTDTHTHGYVSHICIHTCNNTAPVLRCTRPRL